MRTLKKQEKIKIKMISQFVPQKVHASNGGSIRWGFCSIDQPLAPKPLSVYT